jgi:VWFA-related protein
MTLTKLGLLALLCSLAASVIAQETTFRTETNVVLVPALVKDGRGEILYGLQAKDFVLEDDGVSQTVRMDEAAEAEPVSLVIAIQTGRKASLEFERMRTFGTMLDPVLRQNGAQVAIVEFDSVVNLVQDFTPNRVLIQRHLKELRQGDNGAAIFDAVNFSAGLLNNTSKLRQRVLLLISETRDHGSVVNIDDVVKTIGNSNIAVYTLAFSPAMSNLLDDLRGKSEREGNAVDPVLLTIRLMVMAREAMRANAPKEIARLTGGEYELFKSHRAFEDRMTDFANHIHIRYLLSFEPKDPRPGLHEIKVRLKDIKDASVLARENYYAKAAVE